MLRCLQNDSVTCRKTRKRCRTCTMTMDAWYCKGITQRPPHAMDLRRFDKVCTSKKEASTKTVEVYYTSTTRFYAAMANFKGFQSGKLIAYAQSCKP